MEGGVGDKLGNCDLDHIVWHQDALCVCVCVRVRVCVRAHVCVHVHQKVQVSTLCLLKASLAVFPTMYGSNRYYNYLFSP